MESHGMRQAQSGTDPVLFGGRGHTRVSRGLGEFHSCWPVLIAEADTALADLQ